MTDAGCPDDDLATLRQCSGSLTVMPPAGPFSSRLPEPGAVSARRHSRCQQPAVTFRFRVGGAASLFWRLYIVDILCRPNVAPRLLLRLLSRSKGKLVRTS
jgi:hypothetical protein